MTSEQIIQAVRLVVAAALGWGVLDPEDGDYDTDADPANRIIPANDKGPRPAMGYLTVDVVVHGVRVGSDETLYDTATIAATKASLNLGGIGSGTLDTVIAAAVAGVAGNAITFEAVADSGSGVTIEVAGAQVVVHFEDGVSTVADVEAAIAALAGPDDIIDVLTPGTPATVLTAADAIPESQLSGGADAYDDLQTTASGDRIDRVQIDAFGDAAEAWLSDIILLLGQEPAQAAQREAGIAMTNLTGPKDLAALRDSSFESRWSADFQVGYLVASQPKSAPAAESVSVGLGLGSNSIDITADLES